jgi:hypothetical protein
MSQSSSSSSGGIGFLGLLAIAFIVLKLTHTIEWSWWWVLAPLWGGLALALGILFVIGLVALLMAIFGGRKKRSRIRRVA